MRYNNYVTYHLHTEVSLLDSCTNHKLYTDKAVELGQTAIAFTEHGNIFNWVEKKMYCDEMGIKYIHGIEVYLTEKIDEEEKVRDNYHTILLAKNYEGVKEINRLFTLSHSESHFYYKPRITFDEFLNISDNVIKTSACLQSPLRYLYRDGSDMSAECRAMFLKVAKHYDYLEIQHHDIEDQKNYNKFLYALSKKIGTPLIAGTDTHNLDKYKAECREMLQYGKEAIFSKESDSEDSINMEYMTYDELVDAYKKQNCLPMDVVLEAINNTNVMADSVESFELDKSFKYPYLYGKDDKKVLLDTIKEKLQYKIKNNIIDVSRKQEYMDNIKEEIKVFEQIDMIGFMLFMSELITWCWDNSIPVGYGRGSCCGSTVAYITDIIDVDPIKNNTVFSRFANKDRKELGDIDCDFAPDQRSAVFNYIVDRFGKEKTARVLSMGTIKDRACIDVICKAYRIKWKLAGSIGEEPYSLSVADEIKDMYEADEGRARAKYPDIFYYFDGLVNTTISQSCHPAGILASPIDLEEHYGCFVDRDGNSIISINMEESHEINLIKYDILGLKNVGIIRDTCRFAGIPYPKSYKVDWNDDKVWEHMTDSPVGIFQFESDYAFDCLKKMNPHKLNDMSMCNAALRPSGESYREDLFSGVFKSNPSEQIDELLKDNRGYLIFQEDVIKFLKDICGMDGGEADNVRRAIGRKQIDRLQKALPEILDGYCKNSPKPRDVAEAEAKEFLQIIEDASSYCFGYNHSTAYSMIGYTCAMLRYYYPVEFCSAFLNNANNEDDIKTGTKLANQLNIKILPIKFGKSSAFYTPHDNTIYKGIASIKYCNEIIADELMEVYNRHHDNFLDILKDIKENTSVNSRQLGILITLDFFSEYGNNQMLLNIVEVYDKFASKSIIKKDKLEELGVSEFLAKKYSTKDTAKQFSGIDGMGLTRELIKDIPNKRMELRKQVQMELEYLGYIDSVIPELPEYYYMVITMKTYKDSSKPYVTMRQLSTGEEVKTRVVNSKSYESQPFTLYDILIYDSLTKRKKKTCVNGKWIDSNIDEYILTTWEVLKDV